MVTAASKYQEVRQVFGTAREVGAEKERVRGIRERLQSAQCRVSLRHICQFTLGTEMGTIVEREMERV
jgi:hypothetical protein